MQHSRVHSLTSVCTFLLWRRSCGCCRACLWWLSSHHCSSPCELHSHTADLAAASHVPHVPLCSGILFFYYQYIHMPKQEEKKVDLQMAKQIYFLSYNSSISFFWTSMHMQRKFFNFLIHLPMQLRSFHPTFSWNWLICSVMTC